MVKTAENLERVLQIWNRPNPLVIATHARAVEGVPQLSFSGLRDQLWKEKRDCLLIFGTGFGLPDSFMQSCSGVLESIRGAPPEDYRHLSVRSAVSICLDRLMGPW